jgi:hypothetical protein
MKMLMLVAALFVSGTVSGQDIPAAEVPAAVVKTFNTRFPATTGLEWERKGELYEAEFHVNRVDHKALLDANGKLLKFKKDIRSTDLPPAVRNTIQTQYKNFKIDDTDKVESAGVIYYQVELDGEPHDQKVVFREDGKVDSQQLYW